MHTTTSLEPRPRRCTSSTSLPRGRALAATLAAVTAVGWATPVADGAASVSPDEGRLSAVSHAGSPVAVLDDLSLPQLAALVNLTPAALVQQIDGVTSNGLLASLLNTLVGDPNATLQTILDDVVATGADSGAVETLINELLGPATSTTGQLQGVVSTILADLAADGKLGVLAEQLGVPLSVLERLVVLPVSDETLAATLGTTLEDLGSLLLDAGAITTPLTPTTPVISIPVLSSGEAGKTEIIGTPSEHGSVTLTTVYSTTAPSAAPAPASAVLGARSEAAVSNAFTIVSVRLNRKGQVVETVKVPHAGKVTVKGSARGTAARNGHKMSIPVAGAGATVAAGTRSITLRPGRAFKKVRAATFALTTTYVPTGGTASTKHSRTTLRHR